MKNKALSHLMAILLIILLIVGTRMIEILPWWSFVIPVLVFGVVIGFRDWEVPGFTIGFLSGFIVWLGLNWYFDMTFNGIILNKIGLLVYLPKIVVLLISGIIGGLLTGLALLSGKSVFVRKKSVLL
jgi:hypothetical protein